jgi:O-antigen ligase
MKKILVLLLTLITLNTIWVEIRISSSGLIFPLNENILDGSPRLIEILSLIFIFLSIFIKNHLKNKSVLLWGFLLLFILFLFSLFKPYYSSYFRTSFLIPILLFFAIISKSFKTRTIIYIFKLINVSIFISSLIVILSIIFKLDWSQTLEIGNNVKRYIGLGQSAPYQSFYMLIGLSINMFFLSTKQNKSYLYLVMISIEVLAILLNGARTGYLIMFIIFAIYFYYNYSYLFNFKRLIVFVIIISLMSVYLWDFIAPTFDNRFGNTSLSGRDSVWQNALIIIAYNPLFGVQDFFSASTKMGLKVIAHSQNGYFELIFWGGVITLFIAVFFYRKIYLEMMKNSNKQFKILLKMMFVIYSVFNITEILFMSAQVQISMFLIFGILINYNNRQQIVSTYVKEKSNCSY